MRSICQLLLSLSFILGISYQISFAQKKPVEAKGFEKQVDFLLAGYPFNGNADDVSGNGNGGTVSGQSLTADRFGQADRAFQFSSANGGIQTPFIDQPDAISLWFQTVTENSNLMTWGAGAEGVYGFDIKVTSSGVEMVYNSGDGFSDGNTAFLIAKTGLLDGNWHQLVIDIDEINGVFTFYVDNQVIGTQTISANGILWSGINSIGLEIGNLITGRIDDIFFTWVI